MIGFPPLATQPDIPTYCDVAALASLDEALAAVISESAGTATPRPVVRWRE